MMPFERTKFSRTSHKLDHTQNEPDPISITHLLIVVVVVVIVTPGYTMLVSYYSKQLGRSGLTDRYLPQIEGTKPLSSGQWLDPRYVLIIDIGVVIIQTSIGRNYFRCVNITTTMVISLFAMRDKNKVFVSQYPLAFLWLTDITEINICLLLIQAGFVVVVIKKNGGFIRMIYC